MQQVFYEQAEGKWISGNRIWMELLILLILMGISFCTHGKLQFLSHVQTYEPVLPKACVQEMTTLGILTVCNLSELANRNVMQLGVKEVFALEVLEEETVVSEASVEATAVSATPAEDMAVLEAPVEETAASEVPMEDMAVLEAPVLEPPATEVPEKEAVAEELPIEIPTEESSEMITEVALTGVICNTRLRQNYCVGSTEMLPELELYGSMSDGSLMELAIEECEIGIWDLAEVGEKVLSIVYGEYAIELPYRVVEYTATLHLNGGNYEMDTLTAFDYKIELPENPWKVGCKSGRWYWDEALTLPVEADSFVLEIGQTEINLYAGYEKSGTFLLDEAGYVIGYEGEMLKEIMLPETCVGVRTNAFSEAMTGTVRYVYIPANAADIQPGAFSAMQGVKDYLVISEANPMYCSVNGMILSKDESRLVVHPAGRRGEDYLPESITYIEDYAFYGSALSSLVFSTEEPPVLGGANCFAGCNMTFYVPRGCLERYREVCASHGIDVNIEEMEE